MHEFETFRKTTELRTARPYVTIQRRGLISLNSAAYRALGSPAAVELLYNVEERIVGLRPIDPHAAHSAIVRSAKAGRPPYLISATAFTRHYEIDTSAAVRREAYLRDNMLCMNLDAATASSGAADADFESDDDHSEASGSDG